MKAPLLAAVAALSCCGCAYRLGGPPALGEDIRVEVVADDARLVRAQTELQRAVAATLRDRLGWSVSPAGSARLQLVIGEERISANSRDDRNIPQRWSITVRGRSLLVSARRGGHEAAFSGVGYASGIDQEREALRLAADNAAENIAVWLEDVARGWK